ncbi:hypothetical protein BYT27DRAFT_7021203, partial [Phlegmacium glaucopus]
KFSYNGPKPPTLPRWMEETYNLNTQDILALFEQQLSSMEFDSKFEDTPFEDFDLKGNRVYSHLMSAYWANCEADTIAKDRATHGAMLVPVINGSDKTTVLVTRG